MSNAKAQQTLPWLNAFITIGALTAAVVLFLWLGFPSKTKTPIKAGVTFSQPYAEELGLNWRELLTAMLDDLGVRVIRVPAYWNLIEPAQGEFAWRDLDYQMDEIARRNGRVLLAVGLKLPRWPECWMPEWAKRLSRADEQSARLNYLRAVVERYRGQAALAVWQVENEAVFPFGRCPKPNRAFLKRELALVRELDPRHPVATTDSGELSTWLTVGPLADRLGVSVYRTVTTPWGSVWRYTWIPPYWYARHALLASLWVKNVFISEFQMEPWTKNGIVTTPTTEQFRTFDADQMRAGFDFAERLRINEVYFWGVEWWWWMKVKQGDAQFWEQARVFFRTHSMRSSENSFPRRFGCRLVRND